MATPLRCVVAVPARANRDRNPYNALLSEALGERGVVVVEGTRAAVAAAGVGDVVHVHWPESNLNHRRWARAAPRSARLLSDLARARRRGARVVWTAHNLGAHDSRWTRTEAVFWRGFIPLVDGWLALSDTAATAVAERWPRLAGRPHRVTPHGRYPVADGVRGAGAGSARAALGLPAEAPTYAFVGRIKRYKGVPALAACFGRLDDPAARLLVAGRIEDDALRAEVHAAIGGDARVVLVDGSIPDDRLAPLFAAADLVVAPFADILGSGSVVLALGHDRPVLAPRLGALPELAVQVGPWLQLYEPPLTPAHLTAAMKVAVDLLAGDARPDLDHLAWGPIAEATAALFDEVLGGRPFGSPGGP